MSSSEKQECSKVANQIVPDCINNAVKDGFGQVDACLISKADFGLTTKCDCFAKLSLRYNIRAVMNLVCPSSSADVYGRGDGRSGRSLSLFGTSYVWEKYLCNKMGLGNDNPHKFLCSWLLIEMDRKCDD